METPCTRRKLSSDLQAKTKTFNGLMLKCFLHTNGKEDKMHAKTLDDGKVTLLKLLGQLCTLTWWWSHACCSRSASQRGGGGGGGLAHDLGGQWIFSNEQRCWTENSWYSLHILGMDWLLHLLHLSDDTLMGKF